MSQQQNTGFRESDSYLARILFKVLSASTIPGFECNKQIMMAEQAMSESTKPSLKHDVLVAMYNMCMANFVNREFHGPIKTTKSMPKFYINSEHDEKHGLFHQQQQDDLMRIKNEAFDLDTKQLDIVSEEISKTKSDQETKEKLNELFGGADPNNLEQSLKERPTRGVGFFLARNHEKISTMGQRLQKLLSIDPKMSLEKWYQLSQFSRKEFGAVNNDQVLDKNIASKMNNLVKQQCLPEYELEPWFEGDADINQVSFSACTASIMCAEQFNKCFEKADGVEFHQCMMTDPDLMSCTQNIILKNLSVRESK